jgi:hypothetical protein
MLMFKSSILCLVGVWTELVPMGTLRMWNNLIPGFLVEYSLPLHQNSTLPISPRLHLHRIYKVIGVHTGW